MLIDFVWTLGEVFVLLAAAFAAGGLNAVAGGGSFLTLSALVAVGLPGVVANATGTVALLPGYVSAAYAFRDRVDTPAGLSMSALVLGSLFGGGAGAALLIWPPTATFDVVIPGLLLLATVAFAFGPRIVRNSRIGANGLGATASVVSLLLVSLYGGYFNGGLGIMLLAVLALLGMTDIHGANGIKNLVSAVLTGVAVIVYAWGGVVAWFEAILMMVGATAGGYIGARATRRIDPARVRQAVVVVGLVLTVVFIGRI
jgi:uncharacterized membrane protein YfcA